MKKVELDRVLIEGISISLAKWREASQSDSGYTRGVLGSP